MITKTYTVKATDSLTPDEHIVANIVANERDETVANVWHGGFRTRWFRRGMKGYGIFHVDRIDDVKVKVTKVN